jgi:hypothetical protein
MKHRFGLLQLTVVLLVVSCSSHELLDDRYQAVGGSVLRANKLLKLEYPDGVPSEISSTQYKDVLRKGAPSFATALEPFDVEVRVKADHFIVLVTDNDEVFLVQPSCLTDEIFCWVYKGQCDPDAFQDPCAD